MLPNRNCCGDAAKHVIDGGSVMVTAKDFIGEGV